MPLSGDGYVPDVRMKKILTEALAVANAASRSLFMNPRDPSWFYYPGSAETERLAQHPTPSLRLDQALSAFLVKRKILE